MVSLTTSPPKISYFYFPAILLSYNECVTFATGVDKNLAYTLKDVKDSRLSGDGDLLAQLKIPKDVCIPLAFEVSGSSFDAQFLTESKKSTNKKFMDVFARRVVKSSRTSSEWGMCCECIATVDGVGKSTCQRCVSAEIANMISVSDRENFIKFVEYTYNARAFGYF